MKNFKDVIEYKKEIISITCDNCGITYASKMQIKEFINISHFCGYESELDGSEIECDLCYYCWNKIIPYRVKI